MVKIWERKKYGLTLGADLFEIMMKSYVNGMKRKKLSF